MASSSRCHLLAVLTLYSTATSLRQHRVYRPERHLSYDHVLENRPRNFAKFRIPSKNRAKRRLERNPVIEIEDIPGEGLVWSLLVVAAEEDDIATTTTRSLSRVTFVDSFRRLFEQFVGQDQEGGLTNDTSLDMNNLTTEVTNELDFNETAIYTTKTDANVTEEVMDVFQPIRLRASLAESGNGNLLSDEERHSLFHDMLSPALLSWSNSLRVDPVVGNLTVDVTQLLDSQTCGPGIYSGLPSAPVPISHLEDGLPDTDIIVYLSLGFKNRTVNVTSNSSWPNTTDGEGDDQVVEENGTRRRRYLNGVFDGEETLDGFVYNRTQEELDALRAEAVCTGEYLAAASFCSTDQYDRPTAALLHICIDEFFFEPENRHRNTLSLMHELGHALGFNSLSMAHFRKVDGTPYTERVDGDIPDTDIECTGPQSERKRAKVALPSEDILQFREVRGGVRVAEMVTPFVLQVARNQFGCQNLSGAELESGETLPLGTTEEGYGCIGDHWERRLFSSDLMNPVIEDLEYYPRISTLTLAYFADSGWYQVDLSGSRVASGWGRGAGCGFVNEACIGKDGQVPPQNAPFFCNKISGAQAGSAPSEVSGCTPDLSRKAVCSMGHYGLDLPWEYRYFQDSYGSDVGGNDPLMDYCPVYNGYDNGLCSNPVTKDFMLASSIERFGERNSRCLVGSLDTRLQQQTALCLPIACVVEDRSLRIKIDQKWHRCNEAGQEIAHDIVSVICPDPRRICPTFFCPYDCLGTGGQCDYSSGQCLCEHPGIDEDDTPLLFPCGEELEEEEPTRTGSILVHPNEEDQKDELPHPDSPLSDYYVPTERALTQSDSRPLEASMIIVISLSICAILSLAALLGYWYSRKPDGYTGWAQAWLYRPNTPEAASVPVPSENESRSRDKDKMIATILVDLRIHNSAESTESLADTEEQMTESEASHGGRSQASSDYSGPRSETLSDVDTSLDDIPENEIREFHEETNVIRRRRFF
jgi:Leishmanolysin